MFKHLYHLNSSCLYLFNGKNIALSYCVGTPWKCISIYLLYLLTFFDIPSQNDYVTNIWIYIHQMGFISFINNLTRVQNPQQSCLDHFFIRSKHIPITSIIFETDISDHYPIIVLIGVKKINKSCDNSSVKRYTNQKKF